MYNLLSLVIGAVVAIMIAINGQLTSAYDLFVSAVIIHVIGTVFSLIVCLCRHQKILVKAEAPWMYLGGAIGVFTTFGNNLSLWTDQYDKHCCTGTVWSDGDITFD